MILLDTIHIIGYTQFENNVDNYLFENLPDENYEGKELNTLKDKVKNFFECFETEYNYQANKFRYPNLRNRISEYLQGLPTCGGSLPCYYVDIIKDAKNIHGVDYDDLTVKSVDYICDNWYEFISSHLLRIKNYES